LTGLTARQPKNGDMNMRPNLFKIAIIGFVLFSIVGLLNQKVKTSEVKADQKLTQTN
jgi:hypothetical protein